MSNPVFICTDCHDPYTNLAVERYLTENAAPGRPVLFLWSNRDSIVVGRNQDCRAECNTEAMKADGVNLVRRFSGGGAVWHDLGNLCFSFCADERDYSVPRQTSVVIGACRLLGIDASSTGRNDIEAGGLKFSGSAYYQAGSGRCHHGTLMLSCSLDKMARYLTASDQKLRKHAVRSVRSRVVNIRDIAPDATMDSLIEALREAFQGEYGNVITVPVPDSGRIDDMASLLRSDSWIYGRNPEIVKTLRGSFPWGEFELRLSVKNGVIQDAVCISDMMNGELPLRLEKALVGRPCTAGEISDAAEKELDPDMARDIRDLTRDLTK
ncbi:MAG: lipoate--protein ligase [Oscillospiraceae bacterium]|jgi:lipoate-protein ligase A